MRRRRIASARSASCLLTSQDVNRVLCTTIKRSAAANRMHTNDRTRDANLPAAPLISVVLCTYNGGRFLAEQMDSLLAQTYRNIEIVAADDCSSDDSAAILQRYAERDARIQIAVNPANVGFAANFQLALGRSRGALIAPCDQDDVWLPDKLAELAAAIDGRAMAYCDSTLIDERGRQLGHRMSNVVPMTDLDDPVPFAFGNCVSGHATLFRRELLDLALPVPAEFFYDWWLAAVAASTKGVGFCSRSLVLYRLHGNNVTNERLAEMIGEAGLGYVRHSDQAPASQHDRRSRRERGHRLRYLRETQRRLELLARLPGRQQGVLAELARLWSNRESQWVSPRLWLFMTRGKDRLLALTTMSEHQKSRYCADFLWGLRVKRLTRRRAYSLA